MITRKKIMQLLLRTEATYALDRKLIMRSGSIIE